MDWGALFLNFGTSKLLSLDVELSFHSMRMSILIWSWWKLNHCLMDFPLFLGDILLSVGDKEESFSLSLFLERFPPIKSSTPFFRVQVSVHGGYYSLLLFCFQGILIPGIWHSVTQCLELSTVVRYHRQHSDTPDPKRSRQLCHLHLGWLSWMI